MNTWRDEPWRRRWPRTGWYKYELCSSCKVNPPPSASSTLRTGPFPCTLPDTFYPSTTPPIATMISANTVLTALLLAPAVFASPVASPRNDSRLQSRRVPGDKPVIIQLFEWTWDSVASECTSFIGPAGYGFVQGTLIRPDVYTAQIRLLSTLQ